MFSFTGELLAPGLFLFILPKGNVTKCPTKKYSNDSFFVLYKVQF